jgi:N-acetyl-alpha-D-glucosaminyl L-malate synthase BshA
VKRVEDVVRIFDRVQQKISSKLILVGDGPERYNVEQLVRVLNLQDKVVFVGKVRDTSHVLEISDLFLLPSETESFGLAALEAMAVGVPVISSNTGGIPEVNVHGQTGFLSEVGNVTEMADFAINILSNDSTLEQFKRAALKRSHDFDIEKILPIYEKVYEEVMENKTKKAAEAAF